MTMTAATQRFQRYWQRLVRRSRSLGVRPVRDWHALLMVAGALAAIIIFCSVLLFVQVSSGEFAAVAPVNTGRVESLDRTLLEQTLLRMETRAERLEEILQSPPVVVDPAR